MTLDIGLSERMLESALVAVDQGYRSYTKTTQVAKLAGIELAETLDPTEQQVMLAFNNTLYGEWKLVTEEDNTPLGVVLDSMVERLAERHRERVQHLSIPIGCTSILRDVTNVNAVVAAMRPYTFIGNGASNSIIRIEQAEQAYIAHDSVGVTANVTSGKVRSVGVGAVNGVFTVQDQVWRAGEAARDSVFFLKDHVEHLLNFATDCVAGVGGDITSRSLAVARTCTVECDGGITGKILEGHASGNEIAAKYISGIIWTPDGNTVTTQAA